MRLAHLVFFCLLSFVSVAQVLPAEDDTLNYRWVGFSIPPIPAAADGCVLELAEGQINNNYDFERSIILTHRDTYNHFIVAVPSFGKDYTWRVSYTGKKNRSKTKPELHHFTVGKSSFLDTTRYRLRVINKEMPNNDLLVFMDNSRTLVDMDGEPFWFLPNIPGVIDSTSVIRDLKLSPQGTITFVTGKKVYEVNINGQVLWRGPDDGQVSGDTSEFYHHELTRLKNGNYMVVGSEFITRKIPNVKDPTRYANEWNVVTQDGEYFKIIECGTVIEYDTAGKAVWSWKSSSYLTDAEYFSRTLANGTVNTVTHLNGFYFDEDSTLYVSFRDLNRVVQIQYPSGRVVRSFGETSPGQPSPFYGQHSCRLTHDGRLYLFNNNVINAGKTTRSRDAISSIQILNNRPADERKNEVTWEFKCDIDTLAKPASPAGGNVVELTDGSFLVCMGVVNRTFIINPSKKIIWNVLADKRLQDGSWAPFESYRASPASKAGIFQLIMSQLIEN